MEVFSEVTWIKTSQPYNDERKRILGKKNFKVKDPKVDVSLEFVRKIQKTMEMDL